MKKISLLTKIIFHMVNITLIVLYIYPGSILGLLMYNNIKKQPNLTSDFISLSSNHVYAFAFLTFIGLLNYYKDRTKQLFSYLFLVSIILELSHIFIPNRSFQYKDLLGNFFGVFLVFVIFCLYKFLKKQNEK